MTRNPFSTILDKKNLLILKRTDLPVYNRLKVVSLDKPWLRYLALGIYKNLTAHFFLQAVEVLNYGA
jgi:hypothetical protein